MKATRVCGDVLRECDSGEHKISLVQLQKGTLHLLRETLLRSVFLFAFSNTKIYCSFDKHLHGNKFYIRNISIFLLHEKYGIRDIL